MLLRINFWFSAMSLLQPGNYDDIWGHEIDKTANVYKKTFPMRSKKLINSLFCCRRVNAGI